MSLALAKVLAEYEKVKVDNKTFTINKNIGWDSLVKAEEVYTRFLIDNRFSFFTRKQIEESLINRGMLDAGWERLLVKTYQQITITQEDLYNSRENKPRVQQITKTLAGLRKSIMIIMGDYVKYTNNSLEDLAEKHKEIEMIKMGTKRRISPRLLERIYINKMTYRLDDKEIRALARSSMWRALWASKKGGCFRYYPMTTEQVRLVEFSLLYDSVSKAAERPEQYVIENDDMLDGWISLQSKKDTSGPAPKKNSAEKHGTVFQMVNNKDDAQQVISSNPVDVIDKQALKIAAIKKGPKVAKR